MKTKITLEAEKELLLKKQPYFKCLLITGYSFVGIGISAIIGPSCTLFIVPGLNQTIVPMIAPIAIGGLIVTLFGVLGIKLTKSEQARNSSQIGLIDYEISDFNTKDDPASLSSFAHMAALLSTSKPVNDSPPKLTIIPIIESTTDDEVPPVIPQGQENEVQYTTCPSGP